MNTRLMALAAMALTMTACGPQHEAEALVREFMERNIAEPSALRIDDFERMDSTRRIGDSTIATLRQNLEQSDIYNKGIEYGEAQPHTTLRIVRVKFRIGEEERSNTFYLDERIESVVAVKEN